MSLSCAISPRQKSGAGLCYVDMSCPPEVFTSAQAAAAPQGRTIIAHGFIRGSRERLRLACFPLLFLLARGRTTARKEKQQRACAGAFARHPWMNPWAMIVAPDSRALAARGKVQCLPWVTVTRARSPEHASATGCYGWAGPCRPRATQAQPAQKLTHTSSPNLVSLQALIERFHAHI